MIQHRNWDSDTHFWCSQACGSNKITIRIFFSFVGRLALQQQWWWALNTKGEKKGQLLSCLQQGWWDQTKWMGQMCAHLIYWKPKLNKRHKPKRWTFILFQSWWWVREKINQCRLGLLLRSLLNNEAAIGALRPQLSLMLSMSVQMIDSDVSLCQHCNRSQGISAQH